MQIANPIYDVVFKYLMEDGKIAKLIISSIIGENIERLSFRPQEIITDIDKNKKNTKRKSKLGPFFTVYRLDFSAKIKTKDGFKNVIIELQKAKFPTDIMRFRKYLGEQFANKENVQKIKIGNRIRKTGLPIISIYFLGHKLDHTTASAIQVSRQYKDLITDKIIETKETFIESLTLDSYVIQIPYLTHKRRNDLEILLSVFDQSNPADKEHHILNVRENDFPEKYRPIIRKLQKAVQDNEIKKKMELEDGIIDELEDLEREIENLEFENEQAKQKLDSYENENTQMKRENEELKTELEKIRKLLNEKS
jgi:regulator of replication initiation timing